MRAPRDLLRSAIYTGGTRQAPKPDHVPSNGNDPGRLCRAVIACVALAPTLSIAAPLVFEETAKITSPDPSYLFPQRVAADGDTIIATGVRQDGNIQHHVAYLFRRQSNGAWVYVRKLAETSCDNGEVAEDTCHASVAMRNGLAVVSAGQVHVFERSSDGSWVARPSEGFAGPGEAAVGTSAVATSEPRSCLESTKVFRRNSADIWTLATNLQTPETLGGCDPWGERGNDIDMSAGNRLIHKLDLDGVHIHEPSGTSWVDTATLTSPTSENASSFGNAVAIDDTRAFVSSSALDAPIQVFSRSSGAWIRSGSIVPPESAQIGTPASLAVRDLVVAGFSNGVGVFRETLSGEYEQVARLIASDSPWIDQVDAYVNGSFARIVSTGPEALYVFDLHSWGTTPAPMQENFELGNAAIWTPMAGSTFSVVTSGGSRVYRQSSVAGDAGSFVTSIDWTNQAIEADVKPRAFNGTNRWVGLAVRRTDANNYYYVTLRQSNVIEIKRIINGAFVTLASTSMPVVVNRNYRLRLEAIGTFLRAYVDGRLVLQTRDTALTHGHAGVRMYRARADFDNVILSHNPHLTLIDARDSDLFEFGPGTWSAEIAGHPWVQSDTSGDARAVTLVNAENQIVQTRVTATRFADGSGSRWFGVMARYVDASNYYYVTVRRDNTISLRKLVNGTIHVLDTAPLTVITGRAYTLRLEAIGSALRAYVNGNVMLEANDTSHPAGKYGAVTYKAAARFDDFIAWEP